MSDVDSLVIPKARGSINVHVIDPTTDNEIRSFSMDFDTDIGSGIVVNGFQGSAVYLLTLNDEIVNITFRGVLNFAEAQTP